MKIFSGSSNEELVKGICEHLGMSMGTVKLKTFITKSISHLYVSNSVKTDFNWENEHEYITKVDVSSVFAKAILNIHNNASVSELFK